MHSSSRRRRAEARRLDVQPPRLDRKRAHVGDGVDRRVEAEPALLPCNTAPHSPSSDASSSTTSGKSSTTARYSSGSGDDVDRRPGVVRLQVEDAHPPRPGEALHERPVPVVLRVELQLELRIVLEPRERVVTRRDHEAHGPVLALERGTERELVLPQRQVERGTLERPAPVVTRRRHARLSVEQLQPVELPPSSSCSVVRPGGSSSGNQS